MFYLGQPYFHTKPEKMEERYEQGMKAAAEFHKVGVNIFAPIMHWHKAAQVYSFPKDMSFWMNYDLDMLARCDGLYILTLDGWMESRGLCAEVGFAAERKQPVWFINNYRQPLDSRIRTNAAEVYTHMTEVQNGANHS